MQITKTVTDYININIRLGYCATKNTQDSKSKPFMSHSFYARLHSPLSLSSCISIFPQIYTDTHTHTYIPTQADCFHFNGGNVETYSISFCKYGSCIIILQEALYLQIIGITFKFIFVNYFPFVQCKLLFMVFGKNK